MSHLDLRTILETMPPEQLSDLLERLLAFAEGLLRMHGPKARHYRFTGEEFVNEAMERALREKRLCPAHLPLYVSLSGIVRSLVSHEADRLENQQQRVAIDVDDEESSGGVLQLPAADDVEATALAEFAKEAFKKTLDPELRDYLDLLIQEAGSTAEELAIKSGKPVKHIRNLDRRLARRRAQWNPR